jgi:hypothetical protein
LTIVYRSTALLLLIAGSLMSQQASINTIPSWDGVTFAQFFGAPNTATYGQTIVIGPGSAVVSSFGFEIGNCDATVTFRGEIYVWDVATGRATGSSLYESPITTQLASNSFHLVLFNTGALPLAPGNYVIFASTSQDQSTAAHCQFGEVADAAYPAGNHVFQNNGTLTSRWTSQAWGTLPVDLAFQVNLVQPINPTPAGVPAASPATLLLGFAGVIALGLLGLSRLRRIAR